MRKKSPQLQSFVKAKTAAGLFKTRVGGRGFGSLGFRKQQSEPGGLGRIPKNREKWGELKTKMKLGKLPNI